MACSLAAPQGTNSSCQRCPPAPRAAQRAALLLLRTLLLLSSKQRLGKAAGFTNCHADKLRRRWQQRRLRAGVAVCVAAAANQAAAAAAAAAAAGLGVQPRGPQPLQHLIEHRLQQGGHTAAADSASYAVAASNHQDLLERTLCLQMPADQNLACEATRPRWSALSATEAVGSRQCAVADSVGTVPSPSMYVKEALACGTASRVCNGRVRGGRRGMREQQPAFVRERGGGGGGSSVAVPPASARRCGRGRIRARRPHLVVLHHGELQHAGGIAQLLCLAIHHPARSPTSRTDRGSHQLPYCTS